MQRLPSLFIAPRVAFQPLAAASALVLAQAAALAAEKICIDR
jgi:hypothetical protein